MDELIDTAGPARVLVIDDEYGARLQVELALMTSERVRIVGEAANGMVGAELAEELQPDVIVLDLSMPVMDGFEALPLLRRMAPRAKVLVRSSIDDDEQYERAIALGATRCIRKFVAPDELQAEIEDLGARRPIQMHPRARA